MSEKNDGGPVPQISITLRDWFAGQALTGILMSTVGSNEKSIDQICAKASYLMADAMLAARKPKTETP